MSIVVYHFRGLQFSRVAITASRDVGIDTQRVRNYGCWGTSRREVLARTIPLSDSGVTKTVVLSLLIPPRLPVFSSRTRTARAAGASTSNRFLAPRHYTASLTYSMLTYPSPISRTQIGAFARVLQGELLSRLILRREIRCFVDTSIDSSGS